MGDVSLDKISTVHQYFKTNENKSTGRVLQIGLVLKNRNLQKTVFGMMIVLLTQIRIC